MMLDRTVHVWRVGSYDDRDGIRQRVDQFFRTNHQAFAPVRAKAQRALVVVKPNWVQESHEYRTDIWEPVISHPSVVLAVVSAVASQILGQGTICVCDAPHTYASFESILARGKFLERLDHIRREWPNLQIEVLDLRREVWDRKEEVVVARRRNSDDPRGYSCFNLGRKSLFYQHSGEGRYYGADYDTSVVNRHHQGDVHEYLLAGTATKCDLFINVPKLKTHKKTGLTCCLKNLVGVNGDKNWLPHHIEGSPSTRGDEFPDLRVSAILEKSIKRVGQRAALAIPGLGTWMYRKMRNAGKVVLGDSQTIIRNGNWRGNDTCWRMAIDLNRALLYGRADGSLSETPWPRNYLAIVDGIIGGEGNGPLCPDAVSSGVLLGGSNPAAVDAVAARLIGFDPKFLPIVSHSFAQHDLPIADYGLDDVVVLDESASEAMSIRQVRPDIDGGFRPHFGWNDAPRIN